VARTLPALRRIPVTRLSGVGKRRAKALAEMAIDTILDLVTTYPRRYIDRTRQASLDELRIGEEALVVVTVTRCEFRRARSGRALVEADVTDGTGRLRVTFFNQPWRTTQLKEGTAAVLFGRLELFGGRRSMTNPVVDLIGDRTGRIVPVYPQSERAGVVSWEVAALVAEALRRAGEFADPLPRAWQERLGMPSRGWAFRQVHEPESMAAAEAARRRLAFDELLRLQLMLVLRKRALETQARGIRHLSDGALVGRFVASLPYRLTGAQSSAVAEITADLAGPHPAHRLLQGEVGSGKTVVAVCALLTAIEGGHQGALMAPTEVLAEQHYLVVREMLGNMAVPAAGTLTGDRPIRVGLLTNRTAGAERARVMAGVASGEVDLLIGTHALLGEGVAFRDLGMVVIDEQHRFGVQQRAALREKASAADDAAPVPDVLVMTATPIPRTAAMTVYGDLDMTVLDEMPPGRTPITTIWARGPLAEEEAWARCRSEVAAGRQVYVVCPLVEESERIEARAATLEHERLSTGVFSGLRVGLLHGQMAAREKEAVMSDFRDGGLDVLVATTVIEVGVDVTNATVITILDAERFGIAQLHQLRGRVGRAGHRSWCYLFGEATTLEAAERLGAVERTTDGFELAEVDLDLRGEGTILGARQKGRSDLKLASLKRNRDLVERAREVAFAMVDADPALAGNRVLAAEVEDLLEPEEAEFLFKS